MYRLIAPGAARIHELHYGENVYTSAADAWRAAALLVASEPQGEDTPDQRLVQAARMLGLDQTGWDGEYEVLRFDRTYAKEMPRTVPRGGITIDAVDGWEGTYTLAVRTILGDLLSDAGSDGVSVQAVIANTDLPDTLVPEGDGRRSWLTGVVHLMDAEGHAVFADGQRVDLALTDSCRFGA